MSNVASIMGLAAGEKPLVWRTNLNNASYDSVSFSVSSQSANSQGITFKPDGTKMYMCANGQRRVYQYSLSTPWDLTTVSYDNVSYYFSTINTPLDVKFSPDGTNMYIISFDDDRFYQFTLSTAWDITTASQVYSLSFLSQDTNGRALFFDPDGTTLFFVGGVSNGIYQYSLSTPWDLSTASYSSISYDTYTGAGNGSLSDIYFSLNGDKMYLLGSIDYVLDYGVQEYELDTPWDISTVTPTSSFTSALLTNNRRSFSFSDRGLKVFIMDSSTIYQYTSG